MQTVSKKIGRPFIAIKLDSEDREMLKYWANGQAVSHRLVLRARMILLCAEGKSSQAVAEAVGVMKWTVAKWRRRFADGGIGCLHDKTRPQTKRKLSDEIVDRLIRTTLDSSPKGQTHWSSRRLVLNEFNARFLAS